MNAALRKWVPALAPALLVLLLGVQVFLGARGFEHPNSGILGALELPGRLLGWGGVALLLPLLVWLLLGWWGFNVTGMALKTLGALTLGLAVGGLASLWGATAQGGLIGGPLGFMLGDVLGGFLATVLLLLMLIPGLLLASARFQLGGRVARQAAQPGAQPGADARPAPNTPKSKNAPSLKAPGRGSSGPRPQGWYPAKRYDADGNELPMDFGASDVGSIRFRDGDQAAAGAKPPEASKPGQAAPQEHGSVAQQLEGVAAANASTRGPGGWPQGLVADPETDPQPHPDQGRVAKGPVAKGPVAKGPVAAEPVAAEPAAEEPAAEEPAEDVGPVHVRDNRAETAASRRAAASAPPLRAAAAPAAPPRQTPAAAPLPAPQQTPPTPEDPKRGFARSLFPKNPGDGVLLPGVRYRDEVLPAPQADEARAPAPAGPVAPTTVAAAAAPTQAAPTQAAPPAAAPPAAAPPAAPVKQPAAGSGSRAPRGRKNQAPLPTPATPLNAPAPAAQRAPAAPAGESSPLGPPSVPYVRATPTPTEEQSVSRALEPLGDVAAMARYRSKLEASGIFASAETTSQPATAVGSAAPAAMPPATLAKVPARVAAASAPRPPPAARGAITTPPVESRSSAPAAPLAPQNQAEVLAAARARLKRASEERQASPAAAAQIAPSTPEPPLVAKRAKTESSRAPSAGRAPAAAKPPMTGARSETGQLFETSAVEPLPAQPPAASAPTPAPTLAPAAPPTVLRPRGAWVEQLKDAAFLQAVEAAVERGAASPVLLTRRMGLGYARAQALVERLAETGVVGPVASNGSRPLLIRAEDLAAARPPVG